jgi:hypothetical protein
VAVARRDGAIDDKHVAVEDRRLDHLVPSGLIVNCPIVLRFL